MCVNLLEKTEERRNLKKLSVSGLYVFSKHVPIGYSESPNYKTKPNIRSNQLPTVSVLDIIFILFFLYNSTFIYRESFK